MDQNSNSFSIRIPGTGEIPAIIPSLSEILVDVVEGGDSIGFMHPLSSQKANNFWTKIAEAVSAGERILIIAEVEGIAVGTVQIVLNLPENQPHRAAFPRCLFIVNIENVE